MSTGIIDSGSKVVTNFINIFTRGNNIKTPGFDTFQDNGKRKQISKVEMVGLAGLSFTLTHNYDAVRNACQSFAANATIFCIFTLQGLYKLLHSANWKLGVP